MTNNNRIVEFDQEELDELFPDKIFFNELIKTVIPEFGPFNMNDMVEHYIQLNIEKPIDFTGYLAANSSRDIAREAREFLTQNGFALQRTDIPANVMKGVYIELTDKGRKLKEAGSYLEYIAKIRDEEAKERLLTRRIEQQHFLNKVLVIVAIITALYYLFDIFLKLAAIPYRPSFLIIGTGLVIFLFGIIAGIIICILISELFKAKKDNNHQ